MARRGSDNNRGGGGAGRPQTKGPGRPGYGGGRAANRQKVAEELGVSASSVGIMDKGDRLSEAAFKRALDAALRIAASKAGGKRAAQAMQSLKEGRFQPAEPDMPTPRPSVAPAGESATEARARKKEDREREVRRRDEAILAADKHDREAKATIYAMFPFLEASLVRSTQLEARRHGS